MHRHSLPSLGQNQFFNPSEIPKPTTTGGLAVLSKEPGPPTRSGLSSASQHRRSLGSTVSEVMRNSKLGPGPAAAKVNPTISSYRPSFLPPQPIKNKQPKDLVDINDALEQRLRLKGGTKPHQASAKLMNSQSKRGMSGMALGPVQPSGLTSSMSSRKGFRRTDVPLTLSPTMPRSQHPSKSNAMATLALRNEPVTGPRFFEGSPKKLSQGSTVSGSRLSPAALQDDFEGCRDNYFHFPSARPTFTSASDPTSGGNTLTLDNWFDSNSGESSLSSSRRNSVGLAPLPDVDGDSPRRPRRQASVVIMNDIDDEDHHGGGGGLGGGPLGGRVANQSQMFGNGGTPFSLEMATALKTLLFGSASKGFSSGWMGQSFAFNPHQSLRFGFVQDKGGPCGVLAAVQAHVIQALVFGLGEDHTTRAVDPLHPTDLERHRALASAIVRIVRRCSVQPNSDEMTFVVPSSKNHFSGIGRYKSDGVTEKFRFFTFRRQDEAEHFVTRAVSGYYANPNSSSVIGLLYSVILTRGIVNVTADMDSEDLPLMGAHGYCSQEMVNLFMSGRAVSNTFDYTKNLDGTILSGIETRLDIGLLSLFEHYKSCVVGDNLKTPNLPIWLVCSESHFSVLFSQSLGDERTAAADAKPIDLFFYDGLAKQDHLIRLTVRGSRVWRSETRDDEDLVPPLEHCIRTKWVDASIDWNGTEKIL